MRNLIISAALLAMSGLALPTQSAHAGDVAAGKVKAYTCTGCHGIPGYNNVYPTYKVPKIGGQNYEYLTAALKAETGADLVHVHIFGERVAHLHLNLAPHVAGDPPCSSADGISSGATVTCDCCAASMAASMASRSGSMRNGRSRWPMGCR